MTAIAGVLGGNPAERSARCRRLIDVQSPYGSLDCRFLFDGHVTLAVAYHRTVHSQGVQSMADCPILLVADARLDNRDELDRALGLSALGSKRDDETLLTHAWLRWGSSTPEKLRGEFAIAAFDSRSQSLHLARDPAGQRSLFFCKHADMVAFASMPKPLSTLTEGVLIDLPTLALGLAGRKIGWPSYFLSGIEAVQPGEIVSIDQRRLSRRHYWMPALDWRSPPAGADYVADYRHYLNEAVRVRTRDAANPLACHLSSGFDSSAVTATAARTTASSVIAYTSAPLDKATGVLPRARFADESELAARTAGEFGIAHVVIRETQPLFDVIRLQTELTQAPQWSPFNMCWWTEIRTLAKQAGADTILTGEVGNVTLNAGGLPTLAAYVSMGQWGVWAREAWMASRRPDIRIRGVLLNSFGSLLPEAMFGGLRRLFKQVPNLEQSTFLRPEWVAWLERHPRWTRPSGDPYADRLAYIRESDPGQIRKAAIAQCGIEERDPTSDQQLTEFSLRLPPDQLLCDGQSRPLARAALSDRVPAAVLNNRVRGLQGADWYLRITPRMARDVLEEIAACTDAASLLDIERIEKTIARWPTCDWNRLDNIVIYREGVVNALSTGLYLKAASGWKNCW